MDYRPAADVSSKREEQDSQHTSWSLSPTAAHSFQHMLDPMNQPFHPDNSSHAGAVLPSGEQIYLTPTSNPYASASAPHLDADTLPVGPVRNDEPWSGFRPAASFIQPSVTDMRSFQGSGYHYSGRGAVSDRYDSGYHSSANRPPSIASEGAVRPHVDSSPSTGATRHVNKSTRQRRRASSTRTAPTTGRTKSTDKGKEKLHLNEKCPDCGQVLKLGSERKKHEMKHRRPYKCQVSKCDRSVEGFATPNDLERHMRSVHKAFTDLKAKVWKCAAPECAEKPKLWPRLDNFRQHLDRMHGGLDIEDLIRRSETTAGAESPHASQQQHGPGFSDSHSSFQSLSNPFTSSPDDVIDSTSGVQTPREGVEGMSYFPSSSSHRGSTLDELSDAGSYFYTPVYGSNQNYSWKPTRTSVSATEEEEDDESIDPFTHGGVHRSSLPSGPHEYYPTFSDSQDDDLRRWSSEGRIPQVVIHQPQQQARGLELSNMAGAVGEDHAADSQAYYEIETATLDAGMRQPESGQVYGGAMFGAQPSEVQSEPNQSVRQTPPISQGEQRPGSPGSIRCPEPSCNKQFARKCDLKKHQRRHTRPYGCTSPDCFQAFGSKNDWKRHEHSQHQQAQMWRCDLPLVRLGSRTIVEEARKGQKQPCAKVYPTEAVFRRHMVVTHAIDDKDGQDITVERCEIAKDFLDSYWCGFCKQVIRQESNATNGLPAYEKRYDHIARHFVPPDEQTPAQKIDDWQLERGHQKKGARKTAIKLGITFMSELWEGEEDLTTPTASNEYEESATEPIDIDTPRASTKHERRSPPLPPTHISHHARHLLPNISTPPPEDQVNYETLICCYCSNYSNAAVATACYLCAHIFCSKCKVQR